MNKGQKEGKGHLVVQYGGHCMKCHRTLGKGTKAIVVRHGLSSFYYHPSCYKNTPHE